MIFNIKVNTKFEIKTKEDLKELRVFMDVNNLGKPNFSEIGRRLNIDRRTAQSYYYGTEKKVRKKKHSVIDTYYDVIKKMLSNETKQIFSYKIHLYRYLQREHGLSCCRSNFNYYILNNKEFAEYFNAKEKPDAVKSESPFGKQAQFDWKEKLKFSFKDGKEFLINIGSLILSASRMKIWAIYPAISQMYLFDFLANSFEILGGVPEEIYIDNGTTMMDNARTKYQKGNVNIKFQQLADDFGFEIVPCIAGRPKTKAKVENPMRIIEEIMNYNGILKDWSELHEKMKLITKEANARICQATNLPPVLVFKKEKEHLLPLPNDKVCSYYKISTVQKTVNSNSLFKYNQNMYSVPPELIGKCINIEVVENNLLVHYNKNLITVHAISEKLVNYHEIHHKQIFKNTFINHDNNIEEYASNHFKELEKFNEQLSEVSEQFK